MLHFLDQYKLIKGQAAFGVELVLSSKENYTLIALELMLKKDALEVSRRLVDLTLSDLAEQNTKRVPVYLSVGGKGVIHKKVKMDAYTKEQDLLSQVLPNASITDFYIQQTLLSVNECWVSLVRKDVLDGLIEEIASVGLFGVQIYLGPFVVGNTIQLIDEPVLLTTTHELLLEENKIIQLESLASVSSGAEYRIEGETINSHELVAFSSALSHFVEAGNILPITTQKITTMKEEYLHKNKYVVVGFSLLIFFFLVTITNMLIGNSYQQTNNELQYEVNSKKQYVKELEMLREAVAIKEQFVKNSGVAQAAKISYYADQVALTIPESIQLNQLFVNPLEKRINKAEDIQFRYNKIKVTGTVSKSIELNNWVKALKKYRWTGDIQIISFVQENLRTAGEFEIAVNINH